MLLSLFLSSAHFAWMLYWGTTYKRLRRARTYASGRTLVDTNTRYKFIGYTSFFTHNFIAFAAYWSDAQWLLKLHYDDLIKIFGVTVLMGGTFLHAKAIKHLGPNYSPCFDSHLPRELVSSGPYRVIRHPDYLAKLLVALGLFLMTASGWAFGLFLWLAAEVTRSIFREETILKEKLAGYSEYQTRTSKLFPYLF